MGVIELANGEKKLTLTTKDGSLTLTEKGDIHFENYYEIAKREAAFDYRIGALMVGIFLLTWVVF